MAAVVLDPLACNDDDHHHLVAMLAQACECITHETVPHVPEDHTQENAAETTVAAMLLFLSKRFRELPETLVLTYIYLTRLRERIGVQEQVLRYTARHRLAFTAMMLASKMLHDEHYQNSLWAKSCWFKIDCAQLCAMELEFIMFLDFRLHVTRDEWRGVLKKLARFHLI